MASLYGPKERKAPSLSNQPSVYTFYPEGGVDWNVPYFGISIWRTEFREQAVRAPTSSNVGGALYMCIFIEKVCKATCLHSQLIPNES